MPLVDWVDWVDWSTSFFLCQYVMAACFVGRYRYDCTEEEMLGQLVVDKCEWECMGEVYAYVACAHLILFARPRAWHALGTLSRLHLPFHSLHAPCLCFSCSPVADVFVCHLAPCRPHAVPAVRSPLVPCTGSFAAWLRRLWTPPWAPWWVLGGRLSLAAFPPRRTPSRPLPSRYVGHPQPRAHCVGGVVGCACVVRDASLPRVVVRS